VAKVDLENAEPAIVRAQNQLLALRERLRFLLGRDGRPVDAQGDLAVEIAPYPEYGNSLAVAVSNRPELSEIRHRIGIVEELVTIAAAGTMPKLDVRGTVGYLDSSFGGLDASGKTWSVGLFASWPLFDGLRTRGRVAQVKSDQNRLRIEEAQLLDSVALQVRDAINAVHDAGEVVRAIADTVGQAERLLALAEKGYEYGVKTKLEVDDANLNLNQARVNLARARRDYLVANVALRYAMGTLGEGMTASYDKVKPFTPATTPAGVAGELLRGVPALPR
jgi:HAE1 family hydrophobic/amphiphilic exporter-1